MQIAVRWINNKLIPLNPVEQLKEGADYIIEIKQKRNTQFHRKFFSLLNLVYENQNEFNTFETFRKIFTMRCGYYQSIETKKGIVHLPKSISFAKMDNIEFEKLYNNALDEAYKMIGVDSETFKQLLNY